MSMYSCPRSGSGMLWTLHFHGASGSTPQAKGRLLNLGNMCIRLGSEMLRCSTCFNLVRCIRTGCRDAARAGGPVQPGQHVLHELQPAVPEPHGAAGARVPVGRLHGGPQPRQPARQPRRASRGVWRADAQAVAGAPHCLGVQGLALCQLFCAGLWQARSDWLKSGSMWVQGDVYNDVKFCGTASRLHGHCTLHTRTSR